MTNQTSTSNFTEKKQASILAEFLNIDANSIYYWTEGTLTVGEDAIGEYVVVEGTQEHFAREDQFSNFEKLHQTEDYTIFQTVSANENVDYEYIANETGYSVETVKKGYEIFNHEGILCIQKLDSLDDYGVGRFASDKEAAKAAKKDGIKILETEDEDGDVYFALDTEQNRKDLITQGYKTKMKRGF